MEHSRAVVVTGAGSGLGAAAVRRFLAAGYAVHGFDLNPGDAPVPEAAAAQFFPAAVDVTDDAAVGRAVAAAAAVHEIVGLVHCAGIAAFGPAQPGHLLAPDTGEPFDNLAAIERTLRVNLLGSFVTVRRVAASMAAREVPAGAERGFIVLTSSGAATDGKAGQSAYSASKSGVIGMTLPLARELGAFGIRVATIAPGLFDTPILDGTPKLTRHVPFPARVGNPEEFAALAHHIAENAYINGEVIRIDGGIRGEFASPAPFVR
ncbi:SDR family NAD(P)-dependent oxidoreductase [Brevibacterium album]|uniref:SDR family NAD(P)-dependent oxidoreductase n=1 Tax=Brevibacterium album TaxID=417948 RepID=UPI000425FC76|nr:SDR family NAD(P)-dependent oxidoreductase [Brevibacterium album]